MEKTLAKLMANSQQMSRGGMEDGNPHMAIFEQRNSEQPMSSGRNKTSFHPGTHYSTRTVTGRRP